MIDIQREIESRNLESRILLQVHDELVFAVQNSDRNLVKCYR